MQEKSLVRYLCVRRAVSAWIFFFEFSLASLEGWLPRVDNRLRSLLMERKICFPKQFYGLSCYFFHVFRLLTFIHTYSHFCFLLLSVTLILTTYFYLTLVHAHLTVLCALDMPIGNLHNQNHHKTQITEILPVLTATTTKSAVSSVSKCPLFVRRV